MKKETRYEMLSHIDQKYIDEAYPKKRSPASVIIPIAACICAVALIAPVAIMSLPTTSPEDADGGIMLQQAKEHVDYAVPEPEQTEPSTSASAPESTEPIEEPAPEPIELTPIVVDDAVRDAYLSGYTTLSIGREIASNSNGCFAAPPETEDVTFTWNDVVDLYGKDVRPLYVPDTLIGTDMESAEYTFRRVTEALAPYEVGDYYSTYVRMVYEEYPERDLSPLNRGVHISAAKTSYTDVTETMRYEMTLNAEESTSYYNGVPVLFYVPSSSWSSSIMSGSEALTETNDIHLTVEYQELLKQFIEMHPELERLSFSTCIVEWDAYLKENGIPDGDPMYKSNIVSGYLHYHAILVYDGIEYTLESNLDFKTFAAIVASLIE